MSNKSPFFKQIIRLEEEILKEMEGQEFCQVASKQLKTLDISSFEGMRTIQQCLPLTKVVPQYYSVTGFGKCNLTLVNNGKFFILVMFMDDISTEIHDHGFEGAFIPLQGNPVQLLYQFRPQQKKSDYLETGELTCQSYSILSPGEVVTINQGMIHMLERPKGNQFSLLIGRVLPHGRSNHFFLYPGLKVKNRDGWSYLSRIISTFQGQPLPDLGDVSALLKTLEADELIQLFLRVGPELAQKDMLKDEIRMIRDFARTELEKLDIWKYVSGHVDYLLRSKAKVSVLVR